MLSVKHIHYVFNLNQNNKLRTRISFFFLSLFQEEYNNFVYYIVIILLHIWKWWKFYGSKVVLAGKWSTYKFYITPLISSFRMYPMLSYPELIYPTPIHSSGKRWYILYVRIHVYRWLYLSCPRLTLWFGCYCSWYHSFSLLIPRITNEQTVSLNVNRT